MYQRVFAWHLNLSVYRNARSLSVFLAVRRPVLKSLKQTLEAALGARVVLGKPPDRLCQPADLLWYSPVCSSQQLPAVTAAPL